jgi:hypothetical protein
MPTKVLVTAGYRWSLIALMLGCLALNAGANLLAVGVLDEGIEGAAVAASVSYLVTFVTLTAYALSKALGAWDVAMHVGELSVVIAYVIAAVWGIESVAGPGGGPLLEDLALAAAKLLAFLVLLSPCLMRAQSRYGTLTAIRSHLPWVRR